jgi:hypothetical protein
MKTIQAPIRLRPQIKTQRSVRDVLFALLAVRLLLMTAAEGVARPVTHAWPASGGHTSVVAAGLAGCYATGNAPASYVEIRDINANLQHQITREKIMALIPGLSLPGGQDG